MNQHDAQRTMFHAGVAVGAAERTDAAAGRAALRTLADYHMSLAVDGHNGDQHATSLWLMDRFRQHVDKEARARNGNDENPLA